MLLAGDLTSYIFPLNKNLWSTSFTLLVGGISCLAFAFFVFLVDLRDSGRYFKFAKVFGVNSIFSYVLVGMITFIFYDDGIWGGEDSIATGGCIKTGEETPGFSTIFTIAAISIALATVSKRKTHQK